MNDIFYNKSLANLSGLRGLYPSQFSGTNIGFSWPDGWHSIVSRVCDEVAEDHPEVRWTQIKEKWGGLRMYYNDGPLHLDFIDPSGKHSHLLAGAPDSLSEIIPKADAESMRTCMACGAAGTQFRKSGWIVTICPSCTGRL